MLRSSPTIRARLFALVLVVVLPTAGIAAGGAVLLWRSGQADIERDLRSRSQAMAFVFGQEFETAKATLRTLAVSDSIQAGDLPVFYRQLTRTPIPAGSRIVLSDEAGHMLMNSLLPYGSRLPVRGEPPLERSIFQTGNEYVSDLFRSPITGAGIVSVDVPVFRDGHVAYVLTMILTPAYLADVLREQVPLDPGLVGTLFDSRRVAVARRPDPESSVGRTATPTLQAVLARGEQSGVFNSPGLNGEPVISAYTRVPKTDWAAFVAMKRSAVEAKLWLSLLSLAAIGGVALALGLLAGLFQARRITRSIRRLAECPGDTNSRGGVREIDEAAAVLAEAGRALAESEERFRTLTDSMPQMVWSATPDGCHDYHNRRWHELVGESPGAVSDDGWNQVVHPDDAGRAEALWRQCVATGVPYEIEFRVRLSDGRFRWMLGRALPIRNAQGAIVRWFGTCTDIEDTVAAREALSRSREELERLVEERTRDLKATQARLAQAQRMEALGQLAGGVAHDFNNVLQTVQSSGALIGQRVDEPEKVRTYARLIVGAAERGAAITRRLLAFSRRAELRADVVDVATLLRGVRDILAHTLGSGMEVRLDIAADLPAIVVDAGQLETVLVNLATNARDAMAGSGTLILAAAAETVPETGPQDGSAGHSVGLKPGTYVRLWAADTGPGMPPDVLERASEPFFTTKPPGQGTGLGLAMARGFAQQSGGGLFIRSAPQQGTTVSLWFPAAGQPGGPAAPGRRTAGQQATPMLRHAGARILVVDDDPIVRETMAMQLEDSGHETATADGGVEALALLDADPAIDLLLSDLSMPGMDGAALIAEAQRRRPGLPAILLTGFVTTAAETAIGTVADGPFLLVHKPVSGPALARSIDGLLAVSRAPAPAR